MPDVDSVKEYLDRGTWLNKDQSLAVLEVFRLYNSKDKFSKGQIEQDNDRAAEYFGVTNNWNQAGYMLPDGRMLDFSAGQGPVRVIDHREIKDVIDIENDNTGREAMIQFMNYGNIRMQQNGIDVTQRLTDEQKQVISEFVRQTDDFYVDISNTDGRVVQSFQYHLAYAPHIFWDMEAYFNSLELDYDMEEELDIPFA